jgi:DNA mismatch endonuclease (patch repair protein)
MRRIRARNTGPELAARRIVTGLGYRGYRLHRSDIPGKPDLAWLGRRIAIFVHGCFWHSHTCKVGRRRPRSNTDYWIPKLARNKERDRAHRARLNRDGWRTLVIWECELANEEKARRKISSFLSQLWRQPNRAKPSRKKQHPARGWA